MVEKVSNVLNQTFKAVSRFPHIDGDFEGRASAIQKLQAQGEKRARLYGDDPNGPLGGLNSFYLLVDEPEVYGLPKDPKLPSRHLKSSGALSAVSGAVLGLVALVGLRKRRMDEIESGGENGKRSEN